jgi:hypothetical protein
MTQVRFYNIAWVQQELGPVMPAEVIIDIDESLLDDEDADTRIASVLLAQYWCPVNRFDYEFI